MSPCPTSEGRRWWATLAAPVAVMMAAGCAGVLGIDEWDVEPGGVGGATASSADSTAAPSATSATTSGSTGVGTGGPTEGGGAASSDGGGGGAGDGRGDAGSGGQGGATCATMSDPQNCGRCGRSCWGGACDGGECQPVVLAAGISAMETVLAAAGDHVVWIETSGEVRRVRKSSPGSFEPVGGTTSEIHGLAGGLAGDGRAAFFYSQYGALFRNDVDGTGPVQLLSDADGIYSPERLTFDYPYVYWVDINGTGVRRSNADIADDSELYCDVQYVRDSAIHEGRAFFTAGSSSDQMVVRWCAGSGLPTVFVSYGVLSVRELEADPETGWIYLSGTTPEGKRQITRKSAVDLTTYQVIVEDVPILRLVSTLSEGADRLIWRGANDGIFTTPKEPGGPIDVLVEGAARAAAGDREGIYWIDDGANLWGWRRDAP